MSLFDAEALTTGTTDALVLDLVEWIATEPRLYSEVIETCAAGLRCKTR